MLSLSLSLTVVALLLVARSLQEEGLKEAQTRAVWGAVLAGLGQGLLMLGFNWAAVAAIFLCSLIAFSVVIVARKSSTT
ncbi:hypothetical protein F8S09_15940 [Deinococcus sp. SDU3-2]|uniref:Uncharacterized protein n=1 Tax=Deinococcus terrestris TaxID=2651870 RepID=A0A7X1NYI2_9DEIO|nr:hypothetical protein [Deinococcus terrestris]MPY68147.1 hypothetical protein [Deinococcus terrestris]